MICEGNLRKALCAIKVLASFRCIISEPDKLHGNFWVKKQNIGVFGNTNNNNNNNNNNPSSSPPHPQSSSPQSSGPRGNVGLVNSGNTCYMNSCLQCLFNTPRLKIYFTSKKYKQNLNSASRMKGRIAQGFADTLMQVSQSSSAVTLTQFKQLCGELAPQLCANNAQQDSHEFMTILTDGLSEDLNKGDQKRTKPVEKTYEVRASEAHERAKLASHK